MELVAVDRETMQADFRAVVRATLAEPCPCDGCPLRARCAAERLACEAFYLYVQRRRWRRGRREPTREMYEAVMADVSPEPATLEPLARESAADRAAALVGVRIRGRVVTGWMRDRQGAVKLVLHCDECGHDARRGLSKFVHDVAGGTVQPCRCVRLRAAAVHSELCRLESDASLDARAAHARLRELAKAGQIDARMHECERPNSAVAPS